MTQSSKLRLMVIIGCLIPLGLTVNSDMASAESIDRFDVVIEIAPDSQLSVEETIVYDFGEEDRHGIYRDIPETFYGNTTILSVTDESGNPYPYTVSNTYQGIEAKIGDPDSTLTGVHTYVIHYTVDQEISFFEDHDELYWNAFGDGWGLEIQNAQVTVITPAVNPAETQSTCYTGFHGETTQACSIEVTANESTTQFTFKANTTLNAWGDLNEDMTVVVGLPKGLLREPLIWDAPRHAYKARTLLEKTAREMPGLLLAILLANFSIRRWKKDGKDPIPKTPVVPIYEPPDNLSAAEMEIAWKGSLSPRSVTATLFELGVKGLIEIHAIEKKYGKPGLKFKRTPASYKSLPELTTFQTYLFEKLFNQGKLDERNLSELRYKLSNYKYPHQKMMRTELMGKGYYKNTPGNKTMFLMIGLGLLGMMLSTGLAQGFGPGIGLTLFSLASLLTLILGALMTQKTPKGIETTQRIKGFQWFLKVTEQARLKFHNPPAQTLQLFQSLLPYAVILRVEKQWGKSFKSLIENELNSNDTTLYWMHFNPMQYGGMSWVTHSIQSTATVSQSSGHSSSGFSGGSSGGGGGGGGGGSW